MYHRLKNGFGGTRWYSLVTRLKSKLRPFGDSAILNARWMHGLRRTYQRRGNRFRRTQWYLMRLEVVPDLLVSVGKLNLWWIRRWLSDYNNHKVAAP
jgi:hypothetical protein